MLFWTPAFREKKAPFAYHFTAFQVKEKNKLPKQVKETLTVFTETNTDTEPEAKQVLAVRSSRRALGQCLPHLPTGKNQSSYSAD